MSWSSLLGHETPPYSSYEQGEAICICRILELKSHRGDFFFFKAYNFQSDNVSKYSLDLIQISLKCPGDKAKAWYPEPQATQGWVRLFVSLPALRPISLFSFLQSHGYC